MTDRPLLWNARYAQQWPQAFAISGFAEPLLPSVDRGNAFADAPPFQDRCGAVKAFSRGEWLDILVAEFPGHWEPEITS